MSNPLDRMADVKTPEGRGYLQDALDILYRLVSGGLSYLNFTSAVQADLKAGRESPGYHFAFEGTFSASDTRSRLVRADTVFTEIVAERETAGAGGTTTLEVLVNGTAVDPAVEIDFAAADGADLQTKLAISTAVGKDVKLTINLSAVETGSPAGLWVRLT